MYIIAYTFLQRHNVPEQPPMIARYSLGCWSIQRRHQTQEEETPSRRNLRARTCTKPVRYPNTQ